MKLFFAWLKIYPQIFFLLFSQGCSAFALPNTGSPQLTTAAHLLPVRSYRSLKNWWFMALKALPAIVKHRSTISSHGCISSAWQTTLIYSTSALPSIMGWPLAVFSAGFPRKPAGKVASGGEVWI